MNNNNYQNFNNQVPNGYWPNQAPSPYPPQYPQPGYGPVPPIQQQMPNQQQVYKEPSSVGRTLLTLVKSLTFLLVTVGAVGLVMGQFATFLVSVIGSSEVNWNDYYIPQASYAAIAIGTIGFLGSIIFLGINLIFTMVFKKTWLQKCRGKLWGLISWVLILYFSLVALNNLALAASVVIQQDIPTNKQFAASANFYLDHIWNGGFNLGAFVPKLMFAQVLDEVDSFKNQSANTKIVIVSLISIGANAVALFFYLMFYKKLSAAFKRTKTAYGID